MSRNPANCAMLRRVLPIILAAASCALAQDYSINTLAGRGWNLPAISSNLSNLQGVATDNAGNIYMALTNDAMVVRIDPSGNLSLVAGNGTQGFSGDGGPGTLAPIGEPTAVAVDLSGNVFILDTFNDRIREVSGGVITTVAGGGFSYPGDNGPATSAHLALSPYGLVADSSGSIYFFSGGIRKVTNGIITTVAGGGFSVADNVAATSAYVDAAGIAIDPSGNIYFADMCYNRIRKVSNGIISTLAGSGTPVANLLGFTCPTGSAGPDGNATSTTLDAPTGVALDAAGNVYFLESFMHGVRVRRIAGGIVTTVAGSSALPFGLAVADNVPATSVALASASSIAVDSAANLYFPDVYWVPLNGGVVASPLSMRLRKVSNGLISTAAGTSGVSGDNGPPADAQLVQPTGVTVNSQGTVYISDSGNNVVRLIANGVITTLAGTRAGENDNGGPAPNLNLYNPLAAVEDSSGNIYIADTGNERILQFTQGTLTTLASRVFANGIAVDASGNLFFADTGGNRIWQISNGTLTAFAGTGTLGFSGDNGPAAGAELARPSGIAFDREGNLYVADVGNERIRRISNGLITTIAGSGAAGFAGDNGPAANAQFSLQAPPGFFPGLPTGIAIDGEGNLFIADMGNQRIRRISNGTIETIAGNGIAGYAGDDGPAADAEFDNPTGIAVDPDGRVYVADASNGRIRVLTPIRKHPCRRTDCAR